MNVINCSVDIKADWYTSFFSCLVIQAQQIYPKEPWNSEMTHYSRGSILIWKGWRLCNFVLFHNSSTLSHTWCTLYMYVRATFFLKPIYNYDFVKLDSLKKILPLCEKRVWINQNYHLVKFMRLYRFGTC